MTDPIIELIAQDVLETVQEVTIANSYNYTLSPVKRHSKAGDVRAHLSAVIVQGDIREADPKVYNTYTWIAEFNIAVFVVPLETDSTAIDTYVNRIRSDVEKQMMIDRFRDGNALNTTIRGARLLDEEGLQYDCIIIVADVLYRTPQTNPYQNAA